MLRWSPLLLIAAVLFLWARGMTFEDYVTIGLGKNGHLELRSAAAAVSMTASPGLHKLGKWGGFELNHRKIADTTKHPHKGFHASFKGWFDWDLRLPMLGIMAVFMFGLVLAMKYFQPR